MYDDNDAADGFSLALCMAMVTVNDYDDYDEGLQCEKGFQCKLQTASSHSGRAASKVVDGHYWFLVPTEE